MILVTGTGRCGSSLVMQTLHYLGVPLIGNPQDNVDTHCLWGAYDETIDGQNTRVEVKVSKELDNRAKAFNPKGYWELGILTIIDLCTKGLKDNHGAIKITGGLVSEVNTEDISKIILCKRKDTVRQAESMYDLAQLDMEISKENGLTNCFTDWYKDKTYLDILSLQTTQELMLDNLSLNCGIPSITIYFEDILSNPEEQINNLVNFLELKGVDTSAAINNVDKR